VTEEGLKAYGAALAQVIATTVAEKVAELTVKVNKLASQQTEDQKKIAELARPIEQRVMDRINELPPIVKTRVSFADATAQAPIAPPQPVIDNNMTPQTYAAKMFADIAEEVAKKRGQNDSDKKVKI